MKRTHLSFTLLAALAALSATARAADDSGDAEAIATLTAVNGHEIKSAELARGKDVSEAVARYAKMMEDEHGANQKQTDQIASTAGVTPAETDKVKALKTKTEAERDKLGNLQGAAFESAYVDAMVKDHAEVLAKIDKELLPNATNAAVIEHLRKTREHVAHHLEEARQLDARSTAAADTD